MNSKRQTHKSMDTEFKNKSTDIWSMTFQQSSQDTQLGKNNLFNKWCWENWTVNMPKNDIGFLYYTIHKINLQWIKDLNIRTETIELQKENRGKFCVVSPRNDFFEFDTKAKLNMQGDVKLKNFYSTKETINKMQRQHTKSEKYLQILHLTMINLQETQTTQYQKKKI